MSVYHVQGPLCHSLAGALVTSKQQPLDSLRLWKLWLTVHVAPRSPLVADTSRTIMGAEGASWARCTVTELERLPGWPPFLQNQTSRPASPDVFWGSANKSASSEVTEGVLKCKHFFSSKAFQSFTFAPSTARSPRGGVGVGSDSIKEVNFRSPTNPYSFNRRDSTQMFFLKCKGIIFLPRNGVIDQASLESFHVIHSHLRGAAIALILIFLLSPLREKYPP